MIDAQQLATLGWSDDLIEEVTRIASVVQKSSIDAPFIDEQMGATAASSFIVHGGDPVFAHSGSFTVVSSGH
jgi:hypothetical protein